jgi:hypothetical protein
VSEYSYAYYLSDNEDTMQYRMLSFGVKYENAVTVIELYQKDKTDLQGPTLTYSMEPTTQVFFNDL